MPLVPTERPTLEVALLFFSGTQMLQGSVAAAPLDKRAVAVLPEFHGPAHAGAPTASVGIT